MRNAANSDSRAAYGCRAPSQAPLLHRVVGVLGTTAQPCGAGGRYFGSVVAIYFAFSAFFSSKLWLPALVGMALVATQVSAFIAPPYPYV